MALERHSESNVNYLQVKHFSLWKEVKRPVEGCEEVEVTNPKTKEIVRKYGFKYRALAGRVMKLVKYDTGDKYDTRYFGFKLHIQDGTEAYVLDMPYQSQILRRFLRVARNMDFSQPVRITIFKGKGKDGKDETGIWFQQSEETVKSYYSREAPHGMPEATQDPDTHEWDFKPQHRWLVQRLQDDTIPQIEHDAAHAAPPIEPATAGEQESAQPDWDTTGQAISDDDVPF